MAAIFKDHYRCFAIARVVSDIIFSKEFSNLYDELLNIYRTNNVENAEKQAFQDSLYSYLTQNRRKSKASISGRSLAYESYNY